MQTIQLTSWSTNEILFQGQFNSFRECLENAIDKGVILNFLCLENQDLSLANLDGAIMNDAHIRYCNFRGANLSECELQKTHWTGCDMTEVCFKDTDLVCAKFQQCKMRDVHMQFADMRGMMVTCPEFLKGDFSRTPHMGGSVFLANGTAYAMSRPPVFVRGMPIDIVLLDDHIILGDMLVLRHDQLGIARHCLMDLVAEDAAAPEMLLQTLWSALRRHNLHVVSDKEAA